ncbi:MAG TPA: hypothetical protein VGF39_12460 [Stellaceae bacterium]
MNLLLAIGFAYVFILGWLESIADPPAARQTGCDQRVNQDEKVSPDA